MMQPPTRSTGHFPYRRYGANPQRRHRRWRYALRRALQAHDAWAWFYAALFIVLLLILEAMR